jgi:hypothetical protein
MRQVYLDTEKSIKVLLPSIEFFRKQIIDKNQFVSVKVNHGWWDAVSDIQEDVNHEGYVDLVSKRRIERTAWYTTIDDQILRAQNSKWIEIITKYDEQPSNLYVGVSPTNGISEFIEWPRNYKNSGLDQTIKNLHHIKEWSKNNNRLLYHGGLFRQYAVMGELKSLAETINKSKLKVHFIGPDFCNQYRSLFTLFNFIQIPYRNGANHINLIYDNLKKNSKKGDIVFASFGDSESLLIDFCLSNELTLIGIGRSFDYLFKEKVPKQLWFKHPHNELKKQVLKWRKNP